MKNAFLKADILIPKSSQDFNKWSVVACDQYTSQLDYWERVKDYIGSSVSTLNIIYPEVYLKEDNFIERISNINKNMTDYLDGDIFNTKYQNAFFYIERTQKDKKVRQGLIGMIDLEEYDFSADSNSLVRATEGTVLDRIPPRVKIRQDALIECPHVMLLIDDIDCLVIEPIASQKDNLPLVYDFDLMENSGHIKGYVLNESLEENVTANLLKLANKDSFNKKYNVSNKDVLQFAVGDGNHSLATAKQCYINLKEQIGEEKAKESKARYALVELVNLHSSALEFEAIHRVMFNVNPQSVLKKLEDTFKISYDLNSIGQKITAVINKKEIPLIITNPKLNLAVGSLQEFIDNYISEYGGEVDYIHGDDVTKDLTENENTIGFILDSISKNDLFKTVIMDKSLPRKTFSMGHAYDKRFYLECRKIK